MLQGRGVGVSGRSVGHGRPECRAEREKFMTTRTPPLLAVGAAMLWASAAAQSPSAVSVKNLSIPAEPLANALNDLAQQSGLQVMFSSELVRVQADRADRPERRRSDAPGHESEPSNRRSGGHHGRKAYASSKLVRSTSGSVGGLRCCVARGRGLCAGHDSGGDGGDEIGRAHV